jgi:hypothetical protein
MAKAEYQVAMHEGVWTVALNGARHGPYSSQHTAVTAAMGAAHKAEAMGHEVSVEVLEPPGAEGVEAA